MNLEINYMYAKKLNPKIKEEIMFNKNKRPAENNSSNQLSKGKNKADVRDVESTRAAEDKDVRRAKSSMRSEGGSN